MEKQITRYFLIVLLFGLSLVYGDHTPEENEAWKSFKITYGKSFPSIEEESKRMDTFLKNCEDFEEHNEAFSKGNETYVKGVTAYSDLSDEEFAERFNDVKIPTNPNKSKPSNIRTSRSTPPESLDLRKTLTSPWPVRDQGLKCDSGWVFATVASIEYANWQKRKTLPDLSEQQIVDCVYSPKSGCKNGWMPNAFDYIGQSAKGLEYEKDYRYTGNFGTCKADLFSRAVYLSKTPPYVQVENDDTAIKNALLKFGVLAVCVDHYGWNSYKGGIFTSKRYFCPICYHAVALVGYGEDCGIPYWIARNSWGKGWGEKGYIRLNAERDDKNNTLGGIMLDYAYYPVLDE